MSQKTQLDEALEAAKKDPSHANFFYDSFLNANLFTPVLPAGKSEGTWKSIGIKDPFQPLFSSEGENKVVPVFDTLEKLKGWSETRSFDYLAIRCHLLMKILAKNVGINLNPTTAFHFYFGPELLEQLRNAMRPVQPN